MSSSFDDRELSSLAHDLRGPLAVIRGYAELLWTRDDDTIQRDAPVLIHEAAERLADSIDDLLVVLAVESDALIVDLEPIPLDGAVAAAIEKRRADSAPALHVEPSNGPRPVVLADREHLRRILAGLIARAAAFASGDGIVTVVASQDERSARVAISVEGAELADYEPLGLYDRFPKADPADAEGPGRGGLALYAVRRLVETQGGEVSASSDGGRGVTLAFTLPLAPEAGR